MGFKYAIKQSRFFKVDPIIIITSFAMIFFLFNSGLLYLFNNEVSYISVVDADFTIFKSSEINAAKMLTENKMSDKTYADYHRWLIFNSLGGKVKTGLKQDLTGYVFLGENNRMNNHIVINRYQHMMISDSYVEDVLNNGSIIYSNDETLIYFISNIK
jgi:hypothetical protein